ncbi:MAG TPA: type II toxin-antitoxin system VapC family toxin [Planctomycetota bacterium]|jgi:predicted nucleic acid-binding protein
MKLEDALRGVTALGLDSAPLIYFVEAHPEFDARVTAVFQCIDRRQFVAVTSMISLVEVLTKPISVKNVKLANEYRELLLKSENFSTVPIDAAISERSADLRARYNLRTPDAIQIAAALNAGCQAFLTNDAKLKRVTDLRVLVLGELSL